MLPRGPTAPASLYGAFVKGRKRCSVWADAAPCQDFTTHSPLSQIPWYREHPAQLALPASVFSPLSWAPLRPGGSYRVAGRDSLSPTSFSSLIPAGGSLSFPPRSPCKSQLPDPATRSATMLSEKGVASIRLPPAWLVGTSIPLPLAMSDNLMPSWEEDLNNWPSEECEAQPEMTWGQLVFVSFPLLLETAT